MTVAFSDRIVANDAVLINTFADGESVLLNLDTEHYFGLNATGSRMWERLTTEASVESAYATLLDEFEGVEADELRADLSALVAELVAHRLAYVVETPDG
jgi:hypothetical protein